MLYGYIALKRRAAKKPWVAYLVAAAVTVIMVPYTWVFMVPTNNTLFRLEAESQIEPLISSMDMAKELVKKWSWLHLTRSFFPLAGSVIGATITV